MVTKDGQLLGPFDVVLAATGYSKVLTWVSCLVLDVWLSSLCVAMLCFFELAMADT